MCYDPNEATDYGRELEQSPIDGKRIDDDDICMSIIENGQIVQQLTYKEVRDLVKNTKIITKKPVNAKRNTGH